MKGISLIRCMALAIVTCLCLAALPAGADDLPRRPWVLRLGGFLLTDPVVTSQSAAGSFSVTYNYISLGSHRQRESGITLIAAATTAQSLGVPIDNSITMAGFLWEYTWGFGSLYGSIGAGSVNTQVSNSAFGGSAFDPAVVARFGCYFDRKQTIGIETSYFSGNRPANTGLSLNLVGRF